MKQFLLNEQQAQILWNTVAKIKCKAEKVLPAIDVLRSLQSLEDKVESKKEIA